MGWAAIEEDDGGRREQPTDEQVPHHPAGGCKPEQLVALLAVEVQVEHLEMLEEDPPVTLHDRLWQPRGARGVKDPERVVEWDRFEAQLAVAAQQLLPPHRVTQVYLLGAGVQVRKDHGV